MDRNERFQNDLQRFLKAIDISCVYMSDEKGFGRLNEKYSLEQDLLSISCDNKTRNITELRYLCSENIGLFIGSCQGNNNFPMQFLAHIDNNSSNVVMRYESVDYLSKTAKDFYHCPISDAFSHHSREVYGNSDVNSLSGLVFFDGKTSESFYIENSLGFNREKEQNGYASSLLTIVSSKATNRSGLTSLLNGSYKNSDKFCREICVETDYNIDNDQTHNFAEFHEQIGNDFFSSLSISEYMDFKRKPVLLPNSKEILEEGKSILQTVGNEFVDYLKPIDFVAGDLTERIVQENALIEEDCSEVNQ